MRNRFCALAVLALASHAHAKVQTNTVEYKHGDTTLKGFLAYDDAVKGKRPGVLVVHEWWGLNDYAKRRAEMLAQLGYIAFAADMYGDGFTTTSAEEAGKRSGEFRTNRALGRERVTAALDVLRKNDLCDPRRIAAIGYCFGGTVVLELARSGADIAGVVSFHAGLGTPMPAKPGVVKAKVLACHGADDTFESADEIAAFQKEMRDAGVDWQMMYYGGALHSFTNPDAGKAGIAGVAYNERADKRSWEAMKQFFTEIFK